MASFENTKTIIREITKPVPKESTDNRVRNKFTSVNPKTSIKKNEILDEMDWYVLTRIDSLVNFLFIDYWAKLKNSVTM